MKALSIRQPWAWLIVRPDLTGQERIDALTAGEIKIIENRTWPTRHRGRTLIHAAKGMTNAEYEDVADYLQFVLRPLGIYIDLPAREDLPRGGFVGVVDIADCIPSGQRKSPWHMEDQFGFLMANSRPLPFVEMKGALGFFDVPNEVVADIKRRLEEM